MAEPAPGTERPYQVDDAWSRAVLARRTGQAAAFLLPHLRPGMRLVDCGCGPGSITVDLAGAVAPGKVVGIDRRAEALADARQIARERDVPNVVFQAADLYRLPFGDAAFDAAFACAVLQHLASPLHALREIRRILRPGGVLGVVDGSCGTAFRYPSTPILDAWDRLRPRIRESNTGRRWDPLGLRVVLREAGFTRAEASGVLSSEMGPPAGTADATWRIAEAHLIELRGLRGKQAVEYGLATPEDLTRMADAVQAWGQTPDAFYATAGLPGSGLEVS